MLNKCLGFIKNVFLFIYTFTSKYILVLIFLVFVELMDQLANIKLIEIFGFENINSHCTHTRDKERLSRTELVESTEYIGALVTSSRKLVSTEIV